MADTRTCEQCGALFTPRREHARFCRPRCRVAWNREHTGDPQAEASALEWSITAMRDAIEQLARDQGLDHGQGCAVISEAVWCVTIVDAALMRYHLGPADFIQPEESHPGADHGGVMAWRWRPVPEPDLGSLPPRGQAWEMTRHRAYQAQLAGHTIGETFGQAAAFLKLAAPHTAAA